MKAQVPGDALMSTDFGAGQLLALRHAVAEVAVTVGLDESGRHDLVLAVDELITNAVLHGGGSGCLDLWLAQGRVWFQVSDTGPGLSGPIPDRVPPATTLGGRGLWIAQQLTEQLAIASGPTGTTVHGCVPLPATVRNRRV